MNWLSETPLLAGLILGGIAASLLWMVVVAWAMENWHKCRHEAAELRVRTCNCHIMKHQADLFHHASSGSR